LTDDSGEGRFRYRRRRARPGSRWLLLLVVALLLAAALRTLGHAAGHSAPDTGSLTRG